MCTGRLLVLRKNAAEAVQKRGEINGKSAVAGPSVRSRMPKTQDKLLRAGGCSQCMTENRVFSPETDKMN